MDTSKKDLRTSQRRLRPDIGSIPHNFKGQTRQYAAQGPFRAGMSQLRHGFAQQSEIIQIISEFSEECFERSSDKQLAVSTAYGVTTTLPVALRCVRRSSASCARSSGSTWLTWGLSNPSLYIVISSFKLSFRASGANVRYPPQ